MQKVGFLNKHLAHARAILQAQGMTSLLLKVLRRIFHKPQILRAFVLARKFENEPMQPRQIADVEVVELKETDDTEMETVASFGFYGHSKSDILYFLSEGQKCWIAKYKDQVISCMWVIKQRFYDSFIKCHIELDEDEEYLMGAFTLPDFRGRGIIPHLHSHALFYRFRNNPQLRELAWVRVNNSASLASCRKEGFIIVGNIGFIEVFGVRLNYLVGRDAFPKTTKRIFLQFFV